MSESVEAFNELRTIRARIEAIEHTQEILIRAHAKEVVSDIFSRFDQDASLAAIYLHVDGKRTQQQIAEDLGASEATVSRKLEILAKDLALIELAERSKAGKVYRRTAADRILSLSRQVTRRYPSPRPEQ